jgi:glycosidase
MLSELATISQFCDGVRCDMAMLLLNDTFAQTWQRQLQNWPKPQREFWQEAIESLPGFIWMAEAYSNTEWKLQQLGFQFTYDKCFYDRLRDNAVHELRLHLMADYNYQCGSVRFLENHDEPRSQSAFADRLPAVAVLMGTVPGMHFYHEGQLDGRKRRIPVQLARAAEEPRDERVRAIYENILRISNDSVFHEGVWTQLDPQNTGDGSQVNMVAYAWHSAKQCWLIVVNLSSGTSTARIFLPDEMIGSSRQLLLRDELKEQTYLREAAEIRHKGLFVLLGGYGAHVFEVRGA